MKLSAHRQKNLDKRIADVSNWLGCISIPEPPPNWTYEQIEEVLKLKVTDLIHYAKTCYRKLR